MPRHDQMREAGTLSSAQWEACRRYLALTEAAEAGVPCALGGAGLSRRHDVERRVQARLSLEAAQAALGPSARGFCDALILENLAVRTIAERAGIRPEIAMGHVQAALTRLAEHWGFL